MNILNKTESAVLYCRFSLFLKDLFFPDYLGVILCILGPFLKIKIQNGNIFGGLLKFKYYFGISDIPDIFFCKQQMLIPNLCMRVSPHPSWGSRVSINLYM